MPVTPPAPTYRDVVREAKRQFARNQKDFRIEKHIINEEIKLLRQRQERINKEIHRLQAKATKKPNEVKNDFENFLFKLRSEARTEREFLASLSSSSTTTEDCTLRKKNAQRSQKYTGLRNRSSADLSTKRMLASAGPSPFSLHFQKKLV
nr:protein FAM227B-like isoform X2 [Vicugna pacos]